MTARTYIGFELPVAADRLAADRRRFMCSELCERASGRKCNSPPKLGGVPSRSEGGAVCSKPARSAHLTDIREALLIDSVRFAKINKEPLRGA